MQVSALLFVVLSFVCTMATQAIAQTKPNPLSASSCKAFVQGFYDWYVPYANNLVLRRNVGPAAESALQLRKANFDPELARLLVEDYNAQARSPRKMVGIDFDPFSAGNGPILRHVAGAAQLAGTTCRIDVYTIESGKKSAQPVITAKLSFAAGRWTFLNFDYGKDSDGKENNLLEILRYYRARGEI